MRLFVTAVEAYTGCQSLGLFARTLMVDISAFDAYGLAFHESVSNLASGRLYDTAEGLAGNVHLFGGVSMIEAELVGKPQ